MFQTTKTRAVHRMLVAFFYAICASGICLTFHSGQLLAQTKPQKLAMTGTTMGVVTWNVTLFADPARQLEIQTAIQQELEAVNQRMSTYIAESEISRFNASRSIDWFAVSTETATVVAKAQQISQATEGAFDITVQPLVRLWKIAGKRAGEPNTADPDSVLPTKEDVEKILETVGYQKLSVRLQPPSLQKSVPALQIDLSAIAKGYAVDQVAERLSKLDIENFLVEVGGEIRTSGEKPDKSSWIVGIEKPVADVRQVYRAIPLYHKALASSGDYRNFFELDGKRYSHTIDPVTGFPVNHDTAGSSVVATDCMTADAWATALMVLGSQRGISLAEEAGLQALVLSRQGGEFSASETDRFPKADRTVNLSDGTNKPGEKSIFETIAVASVIFLLAVVAMAIGVIFGRERIKGSCGGIAALDNPDVTPECSLCSRAAECNDLKKELKKRGQGMKAT